MRGTTIGAEVLAFNRARLDEDEQRINHMLGSDMQRPVAAVTAKRAIVDRCEQAINAQGIYMEDGQEDLALDVLEYLATEWITHPDHRMQWPR